jgi:hypothetical protein
MGVDVDRDDVFDVGQLQLGHVRFLAAKVFGGDKMIIRYNKFRTRNLTIAAFWVPRPGSKAGFQKAGFQAWVSKAEFVSNL